MLKTLYCEFPQTFCLGLKQFRKHLNTTKPFRVLCAVTLFLTSCSAPNISHSSAEIDHLVKEDRLWMEEFFQEYFLGGPTIYTLFGSKPISGKFLTYATLDEIKASTLLFLDHANIQGEEREGILQEAVECWLEDNFTKNWEKWVCFYKTQPNTPFLFVKRPTLSKLLWSGDIANVQETIWTLQKHYDLFRKETGTDFDPVAVTLDFSNEDSPFWRQVFSNHLLTGIVHGYGYKNAYFFDLLMKHSVESKKDSPLPFGKTAEHSTGKTSYSIDGLPLPWFRSFRLPFNDDPVLERYKQERKKIQSKLNEDNFFEAVLLQLLGEYSQEQQQREPAGGPSVTCTLQRR